MGLVLLRPNLFTLLNDAKAWSLQCLEAGKTNKKTYLLMSIIVAQIKRLGQCLEKDGLLEQIITAVEESLEKCLSILRDRATQGQSENDADILEQLSPSLLPEMEDWDFTVSE